MQEQTGSQKVLWEGAGAARRQLLLPGLGEVGKGKIGHTDAGRLPLQGWAILLSRMVNVGIRCSVGVQCNRVVSVVKKARAFFPKSSHDDGFAPNASPAVRANEWSTSYSPWLCLPQGYRIEPRASRGCSPGHWEGAPGGDGVVPRVASTELWRLFQR